MTDREVGRWACDKCGQTIVAVGTRDHSFRGTGAYMGPCPWGCGAWINRAFRSVRPGQVRAYRDEEWARLAGA